jgi:hypothetical protein
MWSAVLSAPAKSAAGHGPTAGFTVTHPAGVLAALDFVHDLGTDSGHSV